MGLLLDKGPIYAEHLPGGSLFLTAADSFVNWARKSSIGRSLSDWPAARLR